MAAIVLAGGEGTRLFPLTSCRCKPAVSFGGRTRLIDIPISNAIHSKISQIFVLAQPFAPHLNAHLRRAFPPALFPETKIQLLTPKGKELFRGTADAVRKNLASFLAMPCDYFLILSGDQLYNTDFTPMLHFAERHRAALVISALPVAKEEAKRMGLLRVQHEGEVSDFVEKPQEEAVLKRFAMPDAFLEKEGFAQASAPAYLGSMGIYVFHRDALAKLLQEEGDDFGRDLIPKQIARGGTFAYLFHGYWEDIGTIHSYFNASIELLSEPERIHRGDRPIFSAPSPHLPPSIHNSHIIGSLIGEGSSIEAEEIKHSLIGRGSKVGKGSILREVILLSDGENGAPRIGEKCHLEKTILDEGAELGNHVRLTNEAKRTSFDGDGIFIRDGIIIVTSGTKLKDGFTL